MHADEFIEKINSPLEATLKGERIEVTGKGNFVWSYAYGVEMPSNIDFYNQGDCFLGHLKEIPSGTRFMNTGVVKAPYTSSIASNVEFRNGQYVDINNISFWKIPQGTVFTNNIVYFSEAAPRNWDKIGDWKIKGINQGRLVTSMVRSLNSRLS